VKDIGVKTVAKRKMMKILKSNSFVTLEYDRNEIIKAFKLKGIVTNIRVEDNKLIVDLQS
jgi:hypothetical protein